MGVLQTTVAELVTVKEHQRMELFAHLRCPKAYLYQLVHTPSCLLSGALGKH